MSSIRYGKLRLVIYPNDHLPPHVHVMGADWEMCISLTQQPSVMSILGKPKRQEAASALLAVYEKLLVLQMMWSNLHD
jgi:Domain of unknown function (DUF4160)